jgi:hypothetical protein
MCCIWVRCTIHHAPRAAGRGLARGGRVPRTEPKQTPPRRRPPPARRRPLPQFELRVWPQLLRSTGDTRVQPREYSHSCGNTASRAELAIGPPVEQGSGAWAGPLGDAYSRGDWPSGGRAQDAQPSETQKSLSRWL